MKLYNKSLVFIALAASMAACSSKEEAISLVSTHQEQFKEIALKTIKDEEILILLNSDNKPIIVKSVKDDTLIQLILPIRTY